MVNFITAFLRIIFAVILGIATILTLIVISPVLLMIWIWKNLSNTPPRK